MLAMHRSFHRCAWIALAAILPALFALALWQRPRSVVMDQLPVALKENVSP